MRQRTSIKNSVYHRLSALLVAFLLCTVWLAGYGAKELPPDDGKKHVVATTTMLADLARMIGGDAVYVSGLMGPGIDPHLYQASAGDVTKMLEADIVLYSGLHLEGKLGDVFAGLENRGKIVICAAQSIAPNDLLYPGGGEYADPHIWFDVALWRQVAAYVAGAFARADPANAQVYARHYATYEQELDALEAYVREQIARIPPEQRVLVTAHDAFGYFGRAYGFAVRGLQGVSTDTEAGAADLRTLADFLAKQGVGAIFVETSVSPRTVEALVAATRARGLSMQIGGSLYSDSLGGAGSGADSYIGTVRANVDCIVTALLPSKNRPVSSFTPSE